MKKEKFHVDGMTCASCVAHVNKAVSKLDGVKKCDVNLLSKSMVVEYDDKLKEEDINKAVSNAGYSSYLLNNKKENNNISIDDYKDKDTPKLFKRLILSLIILIPLVYFMMGYMVGFPLGDLKNYPIIIGLIGLILSFMIMLINKNFYISGFKAIIHKSPNMDSLVMLGSGISFIYSIVILFIMSYYLTNGNYDHVMHFSMNLSFETAGMIPSLIMIGKTLESYSKGKTTSAIKSLINLSPNKAIILENNQEIEKDINIVEVGEIFILKPGSKVPLDGIVIEGSSSVDEKALTGESIPNDKYINSNVYQGTINLNSNLICKVTKKKEDTLLSEIIKLVSEASEGKAKISRIVDKVAGIFVPIVLLISVLVFAIWMIVGRNMDFGDISPITFSIEKAISVLVISCPCALGLATPLAIMVGNGVTAKNQILFKSAESLEETGKANFVVLDKTGTITKGNLKVSNIILNDIEEDEFLKIIYSLENNSNHPLAKSIVDYAKDKNIQLENVNDFKEIPGIGVSGIINNNLIKGVNLKGISDNVIIPNEIKEKSNLALLKGETLMYFTKDDKLIGIICVNDEIKDDSIEAIKELKNMNIIPLILSGDNDISTKEIANKVGIDNYVGNLLPNEKDAIINELKSYGCVLMVGDGINDSIALERANIGIAIGKGADIAIDSADVVLKKSDLNSLVNAIKYSKATIRNIKENLFWAFIYNLIMIPIAAGAFYSLGFNMKPYYGALAMSLSSLFVCLNALRLNLYNPNKHKEASKKININLDELLNKYKKKEKENKYMKEIIKVEGMMCNMCKAHVEKACLSIEGVKSAVASLDDKNVTIEFENCNIDDVKKAIVDAGYKA